MRERRKGQEIALQAQANAAAQSDDENAKQFLSDLMNPPKPVKPGKPAPPLQEEFYGQSLFDVFPTDVTVVPIVVQH